MATDTERRLQCRVIEAADSALADRNAVSPIDVLVEDPGETVNRWADPAYLGVKAQMLQRMVDRMAMTVDPLPVREDVW